MSKNITKRFLLIITGLIIAFCVCLITNNIYKIVIAENSLNSSYKSLDSMYTVVNNLTDSCLKHANDNIKLIDSLRTITNSMVDSMGKNLIAVTDSMVKNMSNQKFKNKAIYVKDSIVAFSKVTNCKDSVVYIKDSITNIDGKRVSKVYETHHRLN
jgi:hypothetical protein